MWKYLRYVFEAHLFQYCVEQNLSEVFCKH